MANRKFMAKFHNLLIGQKIRISVVVFGFLIIAVYTIFGCLREKSIFEQSIDEKLRNGAYVIANEFGDSFHERITGASSISAQENIENSKKLTYLANKLGFAYLYTMVEQDGKIYFPVSSASEEEIKKNEYPPFYQPYTDASENSFKAFSQKNLLYDEYTDQWGSVRSVLIPFTTPSGKKYVVGADIFISDINSTIRSHLLTNLALGLVLLLIFYFVLKTIIHAITKPINDLAIKANKISKGDYSVVFSNKYADETGILANALNSMIQNLKTSFEALENEKKGVEEQVRHATAELSRNNEYLSHHAEELLLGMGSFSRGDLTVALKVPEEGIMKNLISGFNITVSQVKSLIEEIKKAVYSTSTAAMQITSSTEEMTRGLEEQSVQTSEVSGAVEKINEMIIQCSDEVSHIEAKAKEADKDATISQKNVRATTEGMQKIVEATKSTDEKIQNLASMTEKINDILSVIADITEQTNLLALNAAIEAARAGEHGRGFAVVAGEVGQLAERTKKATKEIEANIKNIRAEVQQASQATKNAEKAVLDGMKLTCDVSSSLKEIIDQDKGIYEMISNLAALSRNEAAEAGGVVRNMIYIKQVCMDSATATQQIAGAAVDMNNLVENLEILVSNFKVNDTHNNSLPGKKGKTEKLLAAGI